MKIKVIAVVLVLSAGLALSALPSEASLNSDESVTKVSASAGHGGGGGGHGGGGFSGGGGGHSAGARGYSGGYRGGMSGYHPGTTAGRFPVYGPRINTASGPTTHRQMARSQAGTGRHVAGTTQLQTNQVRTSTNRSFARTQSGQTQHRVNGANRNRTVSSQVNPAARHRAGTANRTDLTTRDGRTHQGNWSRHNPRNRDRFGTQTQNRLRNWNGHTSDLAEAQRNHHNHHGHHHDHDWWHHHCGAIIFWDWGFWGWYDGWWYPAWGYDPYYQSYEYDGPIYGYDGLPPDEAVANVQNELQRLGYYTYAVDGILGPLTQAAINRYQRDQRLPITGTIDQATVASLGLL